MKHLVPSLSKVSSLSCESCHLGKQSRSSFPSSLSCESCYLGKQSHSSFPSSVSQCASSAFALVHFDIWGSSRVKSNLGFQYFVTFIDDYLRCTWLFLMKYHSGLFSRFQSFDNEIENQFRVSI